MSSSLEGIVQGAFIANEVVAVTGGSRVPVAAPADGQIFAEIDEAGEREVDAAVAVGRHALEAGEWGKLPGFERGIFFVNWEERNNARKLSEQSF